MVVERTAAAAAVVVLFGSETGNAAHIAATLAADAPARLHRPHLRLRAAPLNDFDKALLGPLANDGVARVLLVVVCSSTGDGDVPESAVKFAKWARGKKGDAATRALFAKVRMAVLCLGDTNYENFCGGGRKVHQALKDLGVADEFHPRALADDGTSLEQVVDPWLEGLWPALDAALQAEEGGALDTTAPSVADVEHADPAASPVPTVAAAPEMDALWRRLSVALKLPAAPDRAPDDDALPRMPVARLRIVTSAVVAPPTDAPMAEPVPLHLSSQAQLSRATVTHARCMTAPGALKRTLALELAVAVDDNGEPYQPGDAIGVCCPNPDDVVTALLARLRLDGALGVAFEGVDEVPAHLARCRTVRDVVQRALDLASFPKKATLRALAAHTADETERKLLLHLCSRGGSTDYAAARAQAPTLLDMLAAFPSCNPPLAMLCEQLLPLAPRYYSVASSARAHPASATVVFNVVRYTDAGGRERQGLCTAWLEDRVHASLGRRLVRADGRVALAGGVLGLDVFLRRATDFVLPTADTATAEPLIMIGPGTGVAPFVGFLEELRQRHSGAETWLFYGCRDTRLDLLFGDELAAFVADGTLSHLHISCSRMGDVLPAEHHAGYVQAAMERQGAALAEALLKRSARVYICGDAQGMLRDVTTALERIVVAGTGIDVGSARLLLQQWREARRLVVDVWG